MQLADAADARAADDDRRRDVGMQPRGARPILAERLATRRVPERGQELLDDAFDVEEVERRGRLEPTVTVAVEEACGAPALVGQLAPRRRQEDGADLEDAHVGGAAREVALQRQAQPGQERAPHHRLLLAQRIGDAHVRQIAVEERAAVVRRHEAVGDDLVEPEPAQGIAGGVVARLARRCASRPGGVSSRGSVGATFW